MNEIDGCLSIIQKKEVYIKITMGAMSSSVICISFHLAQQKMQYPLKILQEANKLCKDMQAQEVVHS